MAVQLKFGNEKVMIPDFTGFVALLVIKLIKQVWDTRKSNAIYVNIDKGACVFLCSWIIQDLVLYTWSLNALNISSALGLSSLIYLPYMLWYQYHRAGLIYFH